MCFIMNTCLWLFGKRHPLLIFKSIFFRGLPKTTNKDWFCTLRMKIKRTNFPSGFLSAFLSPHGKKCICASRWLESTVIPPSSDWCLWRSWRLSSKTRSSTLPAKVSKRNVLFALLLRGSSLCDTLFYVYYIEWRRQLTSPRRQRREVFPLSPFQPEQIK